MTKAIRVKIFKSVKKGVIFLLKCHFCDHILSASIMDSRGYDLRLDTMVRENKMKFSSLVTIICI